MELLDYYGKPIRKNAYIVRATEVSQFLNCPRHWYFTSHNGLNLESRVRHQKLRFGSVWHLAMEYLYSGKDAFQGLEDGFKHEEKVITETIGAGIYDPEIQAELQQDKDLSKILLQAYLEWRHDAEPPDTDLSAIAVERRFVIPIEGTYAYMAVRLDAEMEDRRKGVWIMEHKTRGKSSNVSIPPDLQLDMQTGIQLWALQKARPDIVVRGVLYNLARKQAPSNRVKSPIFARHDVERSKRELDILDNYLQQITRNMRQVSAINSVEETMYNPNLFGICTWGCPVKDVCEAINRGEDYDYLIETQLKPRERSIWEVLQSEMEEA